MVASPQAGEALTQGGMIGASLWSREVLVPLGWFEKKKRGGHQLGLGLGASFLVIAEKKRSHPLETPASDMDLPIFQVFGGISLGFRCLQKHLPSLRVAAADWVSLGVAQP